MAEPLGGDDDVFRVRVTAPTLDELRSFTDGLGADLGCRAIARRTPDGVAVDAYLTGAQLRRARQTRAAPVSLDTLANETENGLARRREVGTGDRYAARGEVPHGLGRKE